MLSVAGGRKWLPLICGMLFGAVATHFAHLATTLDSKYYRPVGFDNAKELVLPAVDELPISKAKTAMESSTTSTTLAPTRPSIDIPSELYKRVRILCLIVTHPGNYATKATAVNSTWAKRCNRHVFVGSEATNHSLPLMRLNITEHHDNLWQKTWMSLDYAEKHFQLENFDFILKADDDTYAIMENLRLILLPLNPKEPSFIGRRFRYNGDSNRPYMSGGAGYVLSRQALRLFLNTSVRDPKKDPCRRQLVFSEDFMLGSCLQSMGVKFIDSRDSNGLERFHPLSPGYMIGWGPAKLPDWMTTFNYFKFNTCVRGCVSASSVTFHYVDPMEMYKIEFLLYEMRPVGINPVAMDTKLAMKLLTTIKENKSN